MSDPQAYYCPSCQQPIYDEEALLCHFCAESLRRPSRGALGRIKYGTWSLWLLLIVLLATIFFIIGNI